MFDVLPNTTIVFAISCSTLVTSNKAVAGASGAGVYPDHGARPPEVHWGINTY